MNRRQEIPRAQRGLLKRVTLAEHPPLLTSVQSLIPFSNPTNSKAALLGLTHSLASSLAPQIRVNAILPGWIPSGHESKEGDEKNLKWDHELTEADQNQHWTGRVGQIEDFYKTVLYLSECGFITGQEIVVDGGMTKKMIYEE